MSEQPSPAAPAPVPPSGIESPQGAEGGHKRHGCLRGFVFLAILLIVVGVAAFLLVRSGRVSVASLQAKISGIGSVTVINTTDDSLQVRLSGGEDVSDSLTIDSLDIGGFGALAPGSYVVVLEATSGIPATVSCNLELERGRDYQFVAVPQGIAVTVDDDSVQNASEVDATTSSLCGR